MNLHFRLIGLDFRLSGLNFKLAVLFSGRSVTISILGGLILSGRSVLIFTNLTAVLFSGRSFSDLEGW